MIKLATKKIILLTLLAVVSIGVSAQTAADGLRFSQTYNGGTARFVSMGGAFGALGADFTSLSINPAGLGVYKSSEFTITPSFNHNNVKSTYNELSVSDSKNRLNLDNLGLVLSFSPYNADEKGIVNFNIGFGYTKTNDFYSNAISKGYYDGSSIIDYFIGKANASGLKPESLGFSGGSDIWDITMAYDTYLLFDYDAANNVYVHALFPEDSVDHENVISTKGGSGEYDFSFSMNISNKLFVGATLGITDFSYTYNATYSEYAKESNAWDTEGNRFYNLYYSQFFETEGTGYNFKVGAIYNPIPGLRIGAAVHTPTFYSFDDRFSSAMSSNFDTSYVEVAYGSKTPLGRYEYDFETPFKFIGSLAYTFKNIGLISLDVERIDYSSMKFRDGGDGYNFTNENLSMENTFKSVTNFRIGGEYKIKDFAIRAGYAYYPSPYKSGYLNKNASTSQISGGAGYRSGGFSIDMAYLHTVKKEKYLFYDYDGLNPVSTKTTAGKFLVTLGFRF